MRHLHLALLPLLWLAAPARADIVGYWTFEDETNLGKDSGPRALDLVPGGNTPTDAPRHWETPFLHPMPQTGQPNRLAARFMKASEHHLSRPDSPELSLKDFTIEAFFRLDSTGKETAPRAIAAQGDLAGDQFGWQFGITGGSSALGANRLVLTFSEDGRELVSLVPTGEAFQVEGADRDIYYYAAAAVDFTDYNVEVVFYLQSLGPAGKGPVELTSELVVNRLKATKDSTAPFSLGCSYDQGNPARVFDGLLDEVRLSNTTLPQEQLLVTARPR
jgi:hypothetical protein